MTNPSTPTDSLEKLTALADELLDGYDEAQQLAEKASALSERIRDLEQNRIPAAMEAVGMSEFTTRAGFKLKVQEKPKAGNLKKAEGLQWLREHGHGGLIKSAVTVPFSMGQDDIAKALVKELADRQLSAELDQFVQHNSLTSTVMTMLEEGEDVPLELLGVYLYKTTKVQKPRGKKVKA